MDPNDLNPTRTAPPEGQTDGLFHRVDRELMGVMKAQLHKNIDDMFASIEYAPDGHAINPVEISAKRDFEALAMPSGRIAHLQKASSFTLKIERTAAQFKSDLDQAVAGTGVYAPPLAAVTTSLRRTPAEDLPDEFRMAWRDKAKIMYEAYGDSVDWKAVSGHPMPKFEDVGARVEGAWCVSAASAAFQAPKGLAELIKTRPVG